MLDAAGQPDQRTQGYWTGLRHVETDYQLYDVWRDLNADGRAFTHIATSGQSAARLDRWLISEHLRARVSAESQATGQVIGYPGDHLGVSLCLTATRSTCYGAAAWRMPLHLLDDKPFCDRLTEEIPAYLTAHPLGLELSRGRRWEDLKRHISRGIVWQYYGEQSTFWFHHLAKERQSRTEIKALRTGGALDSPPVLLDTPAGRNQGSTLLRDFYSGDSATGLFAARPVSQPAQAELLEALDKSLTRRRLLPLKDAFTSPASPALPPSMLQGRIILLYKGKGADRASPASYRPITLLNTDYKLAARTVASRLGPVLNQVVDPTQTGFLPKRWVGDNVLAHLEEISYLQDTQQPGVIVFLDFEKAFDRLDRAWIEQCMAAVGPR
ncbi:probable LINE-1 retrotransposable element ORF2 protein at C-terminar half [Coccomyxa sp. Obi]|nr:probable LINE-1 retrotransposable element ORF2 protein at C-terminar half [Coccomyxa sp. Obi]